MLFILNTWFYWLKTFNQNAEIFFEGIFCHETCGHGQAICLWDYCSCRFRTPSAKYPLLLCFTATDCVEGKKSKTTRAWRRSGSRTTLLSTLFSNDWLGPGPVWPFYYFDAIFLLLQGSRIGGMDKWSKMPNLRLLSSSWRGTNRDRPSALSSQKFVVMKSHVRRTCCLFYSSIYVLCQSFTFWFKISFFILTTKLPSPLKGMSPLTCHTTY